MKTLYIKVLFLLFAVNFSLAQNWMTSLPIAQDLALVQNKMVLMVWEETTLYPYPVLVNDETGRTIFIDNLFTDENLSPLIWKHFVPVIVSENRYADLYGSIKNKRTQRYIDKFNDNSIKIMDANGNIVNVLHYNGEFQNMTHLIEKYAVNTAFMAQELINYHNDKNFYTAYYLASKYFDFAVYSNDDLRKSIINLANIYLDHAKRLVDKETSEDRLALAQRAELLEIQQYLILGKPRKVLRQLRRLEDMEIAPANEPFVSFLYYTAYSILNDADEITLWKSKVSSVNLKRAQLIININS